jgi:PHP family Zn ribbon phosphoesterase
MKFIADLHIHSHYSIATSKKSDPENLYKWACLKGITVVGTGDFTHPGWFAELKDINLNQSLSKRLLMKFQRHAEVK